GGRGKRPGVGQALVQVAERGKDLQGLKELIGVEAVQVGEPDGEGRVGGGRGQMDLGTGLAQGLVDIVAVDENRPPAAERTAGGLAAKVTQEEDAKRRLRVTRDRRLRGLCAEGNGTYTQRPGLGHDRGSLCGKGARY